MNRVSGLCVLGGLGVVFAGCASTDADWRERYLEKERDAAGVAAQLGEERNAHATAVAQLEEARARIKDLEAQNKGLADRPVEAAPVAAPVADGAVDATLARLQRDGMDAHQTADGNIAIVLPSDITFSAGSKDLSPAGKKAVDSVAKELEGQFSGTTVRIEGHTDADPIKKSKFTDNFELAAERSLTVLRYLAGHHKVAAERLIASSRGETMPVADNKSDKGKARNRRVEIVIIVPKDATLAK